MAEKKHDSKKEAVYEGIRAIIEEAGFKTFSFDDIKWTVDRAYDYAETIGETLVDSFQEKIGTDEEGNDIYKTKYMLDDLEQSLHKIKKTEIQKVESPPPPILKNIEPMSAFSNYANGYNYKQGFAGDFPNYDPTQAKLPCESYKKSALSDHVFNRNGKNLPSGVGYNTELKKLHSSERFHLGNFSDAEINHTMFTTQNRTFQTTTLKKIQTAIEELSPFVIINYSWRWAGGKKSLRRFIAKIFEKPIYYLSEENQREKREYLQNLLIQEANHYLTRIEKNTNQDQLKTHLFRYNLGDNKGVLEADRRYTLKLSDFNAEAKKKIKPDTDSEKILQYIDNPALIDIEITKTQEKINTLSANPFEVGINNALDKIDNVLDQEITAMQGKEAREQEKKAIEKIKKEILIHIDTYKEFSPFMYLTPMGDDNTEFYYIEEFPHETIIFSPVGEVFPTYWGFEGEQKGYELVYYYSLDNPNWDKEGLLQAFSNLINVESSAFLDELDKLKEKAMLYKAEAELNKHKAILEYVKQIHKQKEAKAKNAKT